MEKPGGNKMESGMIRTILLSLLVSLFLKGDNPPLRPKIEYFHGLLAYLNNQGKITTTATYFLLSDVLTDNKLKICTTEHAALHANNAMQSEGVDVVLTDAKNARTRITSFDNINGWELDDGKYKEIGRLSRDNLFVPMERIKSEKNAERLFCADAGNITNNWSNLDFPKIPSISTENLHMGQLLEGIVNDEQGTFMITSCGESPVSNDGMRQRYACVLSDALSDMNSNIPGNSGTPLYDLNGRVVGTILGSICKKTNLEYKKGDFSECRIVFTPFGSVLPE